MSTLQLLAAQKIPLEFGALRMDAEGNLVEATSETLAFNFSVGGQTYDCLLNRVGANDLRISARFAHLPFSAENRQARTELIALVSASRGEIPRGAITIATDQAITLEARICVGKPMNPLAIMTALTEILRDSLPWSAAIRSRISAARPVYARFAKAPSAN